MTKFMDAPQIIFYLKNRTPWSPDSLDIKHKFISLIESRKILRILFPLGIIAR